MKWRFKLECIKFRAENINVDDQYRQFFSDIVFVTIFWLKQFQIYKQKWKSSRSTVHIYGDTSSYLKNLKEAIAQSSELNFQQKYNQTFSQIVHQAKPSGISLPKLTFFFSSNDVALLFFVLTSYFYLFMLKSLSWPWVSTYGFLYPLEPHCVFKSNQFHDQF